MQLSCKSKVLSLEHTLFTYSSLKLSQLCAPTHLKLVLLSQVLLVQADLLRVGQVSVHVLSPGHQQLIRDLASHLEREAKTRKESSSTKPKFDQYFQHLAQRKATLGY